MEYKDLLRYSIFRVGTDFSKKWDFYNSRVVEGSLLNILDTPSAKPRREAFVRHFSRGAIARFEPRILSRIDSFIKILRVAGRSATPVNLSRAFRCFAADVIMDFAFQEDFGALGVKDFAHPIILASDSLLIFAQWGFYFRKMFYALERLIESLPNQLLKHVFPSVMGMKNLIDVSTQLSLFYSFSQKQSCSIRMKHLKSAKASAFPIRETMFDTLLNPDANKGRPVPDDTALGSEALFMLLAGTDTTVNALIIGTYAALYNREIREKLRELRQFTSSVNGMQSPRADDLQRLPYLVRLCQSTRDLTPG